MKSNTIKFKLNTNKPTNYVFDMLKTIIYVFTVIAIIFIFFIREVNVSGKSMMNTLHDSDRVILTNFMYEPQPGDIVAINTENLKDKRIIKRVIATEGQTISIDYDKGVVTVDGVILDEDYVSSFTMKSNNEFEIPYVIPEGKIFVMGDNRYISLDSRDADLGLVSVENVIGKAQFIFYPFDRITYLY